MFSVIIPLYNKSHIIMRTLSSVLTQSYTDYEIIIVNDGSTDNSVDIVSKFCSDTRIKIINQKNQGVSAARNIGIANAKFNYIALLDGDDEWLPNYLAKMKEAIELFPFAGMYGCSSWHRDILTGHSGDSTLKIYRGKIQDVNYFINPHKMCHPSASVIRKSVFKLLDKEGNGFPLNMKNREDMTCLYSIAFFEPMIYIGFPLTIRNNNVNGQVTGIKSVNDNNNLKDEITYFNITAENWISSGKTNLKFKNFRKYEIRHHIISFLRSKNYFDLHLFLNGLTYNSDIRLCKLEITIYKKNELKIISILFILLTKILWKASIISFR